MSSCSNLVLQKKIYMTSYQVNLLYFTRCLWVMTTSQKWELTNYASNKRDLWWSPWRRTAQPCDAVGGTRRRRRTGREGVMARGRNWIRGAERTSEKTPQQNFSTVKQVELHTGLSPFLRAWLPSSSSNNACSLKFWVWKQVPALKDGPFNKDLVALETNTVSVCSASCNNDTSG